MKKFFEGLIGATSALGCLVFNILLLFSLPLCVLALMHQFGLEWWKAAIVAVVGGLIPLVGQLGYLVLTLFGAYLLIVNGFDWNAAADYSGGGRQITEMTDSEFTTYKQDVALPVLIEKCLTEGRKAAGPNLPASAEEFCRCYAVRVLSHITKEDWKRSEATDEQKKLAAQDSLSCRLQ